MVLLDAQIRLLDYDRLKERQMPIPDFCSKQRPFILQIQNETRPYILSARSVFDQEEWGKAIYNVIVTLSINKNLIDNQQRIEEREKRIADQDKSQIVKTLNKLYREVTQQMPIVTLLTN